jgi:hypothetical protein
VNAEFDHALSAHVAAHAQFVVACDTVSERDETFSAHRAMSVVAPLLMS